MQCTHRVRVVRVIRSSDVLSSHYTVSCSYSCVSCAQIDQVHFDATDTNNYNVRSFFGWGGGEGVVFKRYSRTHSSSFKRRLTEDLKTRINKMQWQKRNLTVYMIPRHFNTISVKFRCLPMIRRILWVSVFCTMLITAIVERTHISGLSRATPFT